MVEPLASSREMNPSRFVSSALKSSAASAVGLFASGFGAN